MMRLQKLLVRTLNKFGMGSLKTDRNRLIAAMSALVVTGCINTLAADGVRAPVVAVVASADDGNVAANTLDGSLATRWSAQGDAQWIRFDLGSRVSVSTVKIAWYKGDQRICYFDIQTSDTGSNWTTIFSGASSGQTANLESSDVTDSVGQYVRIVGHGNSTSLWNSITEVEIDGPGTTTTPLPPSETLMAVQSVSASSYSKANIPANTLDKNLGTHWSAAGDGQWIRYDLG